MAESSPTKPSVIESAIHLQLNNFGKLGPRGDLTGLGGADLERRVRGFMCPTNGKCFSLLGWAASVSMYRTLETKDEHEVLEGGLNRMSCNNCCINILQDLPSVLQQLGSGHGMFDHGGGDRVGAWDAPAPAFPPERDSTIPGGNKTR